MKTNKQNKQNKPVETGICVIRFNGSPIVLQCSNADDLARFLSQLDIMLDGGIKYIKSFASDAYINYTEELRFKIICAKENISRI